MSTHPASAPQPSVEPSERMTSSAALRAREAIQRVCDLNPNDSGAAGEAVLEVERDTLLGIVTRAIEAAIVDERDSHA
jgi:hypothetical protein